jgi:four helix bundle protein
MTPSELKARTKLLAKRVMRLVDSLPAGRSADIIGRQLIRCGTSIGANYRAACRARSSAEFQAKLGIVEEEADETMYWIELLAESGQVKQSLVKDLLAEIDQIVAIVVASIRTSRGCRRARAQNPQSTIRNPQCLENQPL